MKNQIRKLNGDTWRDEHWVLYYMLANQTPIKKIYKKNQREEKQIFFFFLKILFIHEVHTQRERGAETQAELEKQAPCREPDVGLDPGTPGSGPGPKAGAKPLSHLGCPETSSSQSFSQLKIVWSENKILKKYADQIPVKGKKMIGNFFF